MMLVILILIVIWFAGMFFLGIKSKKAPELGLSNGILKPCPDSPNCLCSEYPEDKSHFEKPISLIAEGGLDVIQKAIEKTGGVVVASDSNYIHAEYTSGLFKFVDDVEIRKAAESLFHIRSASRVGKGDLGANKKRYTKILEAVKALES